MRNSANATTGNTKTRSENMIARDSLQFFKIAKRKGTMSKGRYSMKKG